MDERYEPKLIDIDRDEGVTITYHDGHVVHFDLDQPAVERIERRSTQRRSAAQVETGVMERAANRRRTDDPIGERSAVMRAGAAHREQLAVEVGKKDGVIADAARDGFARRHLGKPDALGKIRSGSACRFAHCLSSS